MKPELNLFGIEIPTFGLMIAIGVICFVIIELKLFRKNGASELTIDNLIIVCALAGGMFAIGASVFDSLWHNITQYNITGTWSWKWWGITYSGGLFTAIFSYLVIFYFIMKYEREKMFHYLDCIVIGLCIAHAFGRFGCFFGGCCYGKEVEPHTFLSVYYPISKNNYVWILPTQLYEAAFLFILAGILAFVIKKNKAAWYLIGYNVFRFFLEYLRGDDRGSSPFGFLSPSQFMSIILLALGIVLIVFREKIENWLKTKNKPILVSVNDEEELENDEGENTESN